MSLGVTARLIERFGLAADAGSGHGAGRRSAGAVPHPRDARDAIWPHLFPALVPLGIGAGIAFPALMTLAMSSATPEDSGLVSGLVNTTQQVGGALGLSVLATLASSHSSALQATGLSVASSLTGGYQLAFEIGAIAVAAASLLSVWLAFSPHAPARNGPGGHRRRRTRRVRASARGSGARGRLVGRESAGESPAHHELREYRSCRAAPQSTGRSSAKAAPPAADSVTLTEPWCASAIAWTIASPSPAPPVGAGSWPCRCGRSARTRARAARAGSRAVVADRDPHHRGPRRVTSTRTSPFGACVCAIALRARLRSACASRSGSASPSPAELPISKSRPAIRLSPSQSSVTSSSSRTCAEQEVVAIGLCEQQQIVDEPCQPCDLGLHQPLDALELLADSEPSSRSPPLEHVQLPAQDGQRRAQLVRGVGDELALGGERRRQPVEHVVERIRQHLQLAAGAARQRMRGLRSPPSTRAATSAERRIGAAIRVPIRYAASSASTSAERARQLERVPDHLLSVVDRRERLAGAGVGAWRHATLKPTSIQPHLPVSGPARWYSRPAALRAAAPRAFSCACSASIRASRRDGRTARGGCWPCRRREHTNSSTARVRVRLRLGVAPRAGQRGAPSCAAR